MNRGAAAEPRRGFAAAAIGGSAGGIRAVTTIVSSLPAAFTLPLVVVLHQSAADKPYWIEYLRRRSRIPVVEVEDKMPLASGTVHCAPAGYHLLLEHDGTFALSVDEKVKFTRPSIDLLFSSAAEAFGADLIGVVLTGANDDGARGLADIFSCGGTAIIQSPQTAEWAAMPQAALKSAPQAQVVDLELIAGKLVELSVVGH